MYCTRTTEIKNLRTRNENNGTTNNNNNTRKTNKPSWRVHCKTHKIDLRRFVAVK